MTAAVGERAKTTTRSSSPTAATPPASPWRSTLASPWPTPSNATTRSSATSRSDPHDHVRLGLVTRSTNQSLSIADGRDVLIAAGGIGLAPLRPVVLTAPDQRARYGRVVLLVGARSPDDLIFTRELETWRRRGADVRVTVDHGRDGWDGQVTARSRTQWPTRRAGRRSCAVRRSLSVLPWRHEGRPNPGPAPSCLTRIMYSVRHVQEDQDQPSLLRCDLSAVPASRPSHAKTGLCQAFFKITYK